MTFSQSSIFSCSSKIGYISGLFELANKLLISTFATLLVNVFTESMIFRIPTCSSKFLKIELLQIVPTFFRGKEYAPKVIQNAFELFHFDLISPIFLVSE